MRNRSQQLSWLTAGLLGGSALMLRKEIIGRFLKLPSPEYKVKVHRKRAILMQDGTTLYHDHYQPRSDRKLPTILIRTPYGRAGVVGYLNIFFGHRWAERGYHVIVQDARGCFDSEGDFEPYVNEAADGQKTIEWISAQLWSNDKIGMFGPSYLGYVQWAAASQAPSQLKALVPIVTQGQLANLPEHAYPLDLTMRWALLMDALSSESVNRLETVRRVTNVAVQDRMIKPAATTLPISKIDEAMLGKPVWFFKNWQTHLDDTDPYWDAIDHRDVVADAPPGFFIAGWHDFFVTGQIGDYEKQAGAGKNPYLTVGPWTHLELGNQIDYFAESLAWFDTHLKSKPPTRTNPVKLYIMGANRWAEFKKWPPAAQQRPFYLGGRGAADGVLGGRARQTDLPDRYIYNPGDPTPNVAGALLSEHAGSADNRSLEKRADVLTFTTPPLKQALTIIGTPEIELFVKTTAKSADFFARLCDVHPDALGRPGKSMNITDSIYTLKPGRGERQPDGSCKITFTLAPTAMQFKKGHRIRLQISSGAFPRHNRNLGLNESFISAEKMILAEQTIFHDEKHPSKVILPVIN